MKLVYIFIALLSLLNYSFAQLPADNTIRVKYVGAMVRSTARISPQNFDSAFASSMYTDTLIKKPELFAKLWNSYKDVSYSKDQKVQDIRYKITLYFSIYTPAVTIYLNSFYDSFDEKGLIKNGNFLRTLHHLLDAVVYKKPI